MVSEPPRTPDPAEEVSPLNVFIDVMTRAEDADAWSLDVDDTAARLVCLGDGDTGPHRPGANGRQRAARTLRRAADQLEAQP